MSVKDIKNTAASVRQRLLNKAREQNKPFNELLQHFTMERFLYRLSVSDFAGKFILKGGVMLYVLDAPTARPTLDIDLLGKTSNNSEKVAEQIKTICTASVIDDGLIFDATSITTNRRLYIDNLNPSSNQSALSCCIHIYQSGVALAERNRVSIPFVFIINFLLSPVETPIYRVSDVSETVGVLKPYPAELMRVYPVSKAVNSVMNNTAEVMQPV